MPITELALLHLVHPNSPPNLTRGLKSKLHTAKHAMESFTSNSFHFYTHLQDPSYIYILGTWASLTQHREEWLPSETNKGLLEVLKGEVEVEWMGHVNVEEQSEGAGKGKMIDELASLDAPVLGVERFFVKREGKERDRFEMEVRMRREIVEEYACEGGKGKIVGGWRVEGRADGGEQREQEEYVQFSGWENMEAYERFVGSDAGREYARIGMLTEGVEVRLAVRLELDADSL